MGANPTARRLLVGLAVAFLLAGCGSTATPSPSATPWASPTPSIAVVTLPPSPTPAAAPTPTPAPTAAPTPIPSASPLAGTRWARVASQSAFANAGMAAVAANADRYVAVGWAGKEPDAHGVAWISADGRSWQRTSIPSAENAAPHGSFTTGSASSPGASTRTSRISAQRSGCRPTAWPGSALPTSRASPRLRSRAWLAWASTWWRWAATVRAHRSSPGPPRMVWPGSP